MSPVDSNETIRQMLSGFSAMQYQMGLLPMPQAQAMAGAASPYQSAPPPPPVMHPSEAAMSAMRQHNNMVQQTLAAAQVTRYQPPPSAPTPSMMSAAAFAPMGAFAGGGGGGMPSFTSSPFAPGGGHGGGGMHAMGGMGGGFSGPRLPSIFNPFAPTLPSPHFATPAMRNLQLMQHAQAHMMGTMAGIGEGIMGMGGMAVGGMMGGPLGAMAGAGVGHMLAGMAINPVVSDYARGRQIQQMTAPFMVSGPYLNTQTGQGLDPRAARDVATGMRHMVRDYDFERTGFNTQDAMRIMQMSAGQGLLTGAQSPDQLVQKVKEISKTVKVLMRITGDPDVRDAIQSLGQMRDLGFNGLAAQAGAVANRAAFARMAGVSQDQMAQTMMGGAAMAGQMGLAGASGANAAMYGAGAANVAASSGALNPLQLARAGGTAGLGQINTQGQLAALQNDQYMLAAMGRDKSGKMVVDLDAYRKLQGESFGEVQRRAAEALRGMGTQGIFEWNTRQQELKDQLAQKLRPGEMQLNMLNQARAYQGQYAPGVMSLGTALQQTTGMDANQARALELQVQSRKYWDGMIQQLEVRRREAADQERAIRAERARPGLTTRIGRSITGAIDDVSDVVSSPFRAASDYFDREQEKQAAMDRGERISQYHSYAVASDDAERKLMQRAMRDPRYQAGFRRPGASALDTGGSISTAGRVLAVGLEGVFGANDDAARSATREVNRIGSFLGLSSRSQENQLVELASESYGTAFGYHPLGTFGDVGDAKRRVQSIVTASQADVAGSRMTGEQFVATRTRIQDALTGAKSKASAGSLIVSATERLIHRAKNLAAGTIDSATAVSDNDYRETFIEGAKAEGIDEKTAGAIFDKEKMRIMTAMASNARLADDQDVNEVLDRSNTITDGAGAIDMSKPRKEVQDNIDNTLRALNLSDVSDQQRQEMKAVVAHHDKAVVAFAIAQKNASSGAGDVREIATEYMRTHLDKLTPSQKKEIDQLTKSMSKQTGNAFGYLLRGKDGAAGVEGRIDEFGGVMGAQMALAADQETVQQLRDKFGASGDTVEEALASIGDLRLDQMDPRQADLFRRAQGGDKKAIEQIRMRYAPSSAKMRHGGGVGGAVDDIDSQIAALQDASEKYAKDEGGEGGAEGLQAQATTLFAGAVQDFAKAVNTLTGHGDMESLGYSRPENQSQYGGG